MSPSKFGSTTTRANSTEESNLALNVQETPPISTSNTEGKGSIVRQVQGRWVIIEASISGQPMDAMKGSVAEITGNEIVLEVGGQHTISTLEFREGTTPLRFDAVSAGGQVAKAILALKGNELTVNTSLTGDSYPASFESGAGLMLVKYRRE
ncbi:MAG: hypothetical protein KDB22_01355 [Planctomycetales bacterium]|nr:hypothetical protein [Planctomycetales bacterium]MCA9195586.1 hypothetical protein [Planctomycetales bacterium]